MSIFKDTIIELEITDEQLKDENIRKFITEYTYRKQEGNWIQFKNGNGICEINKKDGTQITTVLTDEEFKADFPLNCDMSISERCNMGCKFCYLECTPNGKEANIKKFIEDKNSFLYTLHPGTELAINGNEPLHEDLAELLFFCHSRDILANLTVNETTLLKNRFILEMWLDQGLIHGIGVSPSMYSDIMIEWCKNHSTSVIHTIAGITTPEQYKMLKDQGLKILILGYKEFGKGVDYNLFLGDEVSKNIEWLKNNILELTNHFEVTSFDNLAIEQLDMKNKLDEKIWFSFYRGDEGSHTMYIDLVNETFAKNSIQSRDNHYKLKNDISEMLKIVQHPDLNEVWNDNQL